MDLSALLGRTHGRLVHTRRVRVLCGELVQLLPARAAVLDIGCGDGRLGRLVQEARPDVTVAGVDVSVRDGCLIPCKQFDGAVLPYQDRSFDVCMLIDVLHHTDGVVDLLREARRVARHRVIIKDHLAESNLDRALLRFMDWVGNRPHGVSLPYNYLSRAQWENAFSACCMTPVACKTRIALYGAPFNAVFGRGLHFVAALE